MAEAQGKLTGRPGICFVTRGPGATNASIGVHTAFQDSTPMVLFIGQVASDQRDREAFQEVDYRQMFGPGTLGMAKWVGEVTDADRLPEYVARAFHTAMQGRPGPVVIVLPEDMLTTPTTGARARSCRAGALRGRRPTRSARLRALARRRRASVRASSAAAAGIVSRVRRDAAVRRVAGTCRSAARSASRTCSTTVIRTTPATSASASTLRSPTRIREADLVLAIGPRLGEMTTGGYTLLQPPVPAQTLVHIHAGAEELGRVFEAADLLIQSSMSAAAPALDALERSPSRSRGTHGRLRLTPTTRPTWRAAPWSRSTWPR